MSGRPYAEVIGDPVAHSKSPLIHNFWLAKLGIDAEYRACHVRADELAEYFARRRGDAAWRGCNVTLPHKVAVTALADEAGSIAGGAANCMLPRDGKLIAANTDGSGIREALPFPFASVCVIGAGGAARAALANLDTGCTDVRIMARDRDKALKAIDDCTPQLFGFDEAPAAFSHVECVINASPLGMAGQPPMPGTVIAALAQTDRDAIVFDMVYAPLRTALLGAAEAAGRRTADGLLMLVGQAAAAFAYFFGQPAPREHDEELRARLTAGPVRVSASPRPY